MSQERSTQLIQALGFSSYEAKAYMGLLSCQPATAYEIAKTSGIPTSKIYETIKKLCTKGVLQAIESEETQRYVALDPRDFASQIQADTQSKTRELLPLLEDLGETGQGDFIWPLGSEQQVRSKAQEMIRMAEDNLLISAWPSELIFLEEDLKQAESNGIKIAMVHFGDSDLKIGATYYHPLEKTLYAEKGGRGLTLVVDQETVLIANFVNQGTVDAAWSRNPAFVTVAEDYVKHDVYITKVTRFLGPEMSARFGESFEKLRDVFDAEA